MEESSSHQIDIEKIGNDWFKSRTKVNQECWTPKNSTGAKWKNCMNENELTVDYVSVYLLYIIISVSFHCVKCLKSKWSKISTMNSSWILSECVNYFWSNWHDNILMSRFWFQTFYLCCLFHIINISDLPLLSLWLQMFLLRGILPLHRTREKYSFLEKYFSYI